MKTKIKLTAGLLAAAAALVVLSETARADISVQIPTTYTNGVSWLLDPNGNMPFYSSGAIATSGNFTARGPATAAGSATATALAETFTITNGAGTNGLNVSLLANTNYMLTGISMLISGYDATHTFSLHIFDVTTNLTGGVTGSGAAYNFTGNGDLLGAGNGLSWTNNGLSGAEQQLYFGLQNGPTTYGDQVVFAPGHIYTIEVWIPATSSGFNWFKSSAAPQDIGGEAMAGPNASLSAARETGSAAGFYGSSQHTFALALYGVPTSATASVNTSTNSVVTTNFVIDAFNSYGYGVTNTYVGTNNYNAGQITNIWSNWYGSAFSNILWDASSDASGNTNSGSMKITAAFPGQFIVHDGFSGISPPLNGLTAGLTSFQCDVLFAPGSPTTINSGTLATNYGHMQFGIGIGNNQDFFPNSVEVPAGTTNWTHVSIPISISTDPNLIGISNVIVKIDGNWYSSNPLSGVSTLWVDNVKFVGPAAVVLPSPPTLSIQKANPALRIFAGSTANTYDRAELATTDQSQSWVGGTYPVSYSFTLLNYPANIYQSQIFLVPVNTAGQSMYNNEYIDYQATNMLCLVFGPTANGIVASIQWKTNLPNSNPNQTALTITNATAVGTWTLTFTNASGGTLTAPGGTPQEFTIPDPNISADFANPLVAYFGLQPNSSAGIGQYEDWGSISVTGVAGANENDNFTTDSSFNTSLWSINTLTPALNTCVQLVTANTPYWVNWTLPAVGYGLGTAQNVTGNTNTFFGGTLYPWVLPEYYNGYGDGPNIPGMAVQGGKTWVLVPSTCLPTVDGNPQGTQALSPAAFFRLVEPPLVN